MKKRKAILYFILSQLLMLISVFAMSLYITGGVYAPFLVILNFCKGSFKDLVFNHMWQIYMVTTSIVTLAVYVLLMVKATISTKEKEKATK